MGDAEGAVKNEAGCFSFNVLRSESDPATIFLFEVYADQVALDAHRATPHYKKWRSTVGDWFAKPPVIEQCVTVFPDDDSLRSRSA